MITTREGLVPNRFAAALHSRTNILEDSPEHGTIEVLKPRPEALRRSWLVMAFEFMMSVCGVVDEKNRLASFAKGDLDGWNLSRHRREINGTIMKLNCIFNIGFVSSGEKISFTGTGVGNTKSLRCPSSDRTITT